jgi:hypothetical protein
MTSYIPVPLLSSFAVIVILLYEDELRGVADTYYNWGSRM